MRAKWARIFFSTQSRMYEKHRLEWPAAGASIAHERLRIRRNSKPRNPKHSPCVRSIRRLLSSFTAHPRHVWLRMAVERRLREEFAKLQVAACSALDR